jgi:hypothetical protein
MLELAIGLIILFIDELTFYYPLETDFFGGLNDCF